MVRVGSWIDITWNTMAALVSYGGFYSIQRHYGAGLQVGGILPEKLSACAFEYIGQTTAFVSSSHLHLSSNNNISLLHICIILNPSFSILLQHVSIIWLVACHPTSITFLT